MESLGMLDPEANGLTLLFRDLYIGVSAILVAALTGLSVFGLALRLASGASRSALDAAVLTSPLPEGKKARLVLGEPSPLAPEA
jgi:hypothetical protein